MSGSGALAVLAPQAGRRMELVLNAPRANALEPGFLQQILGAVRRAEAEAPDVLVIRSGKNFCSGGDVALFCKAAEEGTARAYSQQVVPVLQEIVYRLVAMPSLVAVAARGAITGGGAGLLFAADLAVLHPAAFVQPYYGKVGFAPDGGWCALLPEKIGAGRAMSWLAQDCRADAGALCGLGLAAAADPDPEAALDGLLSGLNPGALAAAKPLLWDAARLEALRRRLDAETQAFLERIECPGTLAGMRAFLSPT